MDIVELLAPAGVSLTEPRDWIFTFGYGQRGVAISPFGVDDKEPQPGGFRLDDRFVRIRGTFISAREEMIKTFGVVWSNQYESKHAAGVVEFGLTELVLTKDWVPEEEPES